MKFRTSLIIAIVLAFLTAGFVFAQTQVQTQTATPPEIQTETPQTPATPEIQTETRQKPSAPDTTAAPAERATLAPASALPPVRESLGPDQMIDRIIGREAQLAVKMRTMHPLVETYLQNMEADHELGAVPTRDEYFLGKLDLSKGSGKPTQKTLLDDDPGFFGGIGNKITQLYQVHYVPAGFAQMILVDGNFNRANYNFEYVRREFLGEVRCVVFDVTPKKKRDHTSFTGRIWAEDQDYNIVRFNGTYGPSTRTKLYFHFDSWREQIGSGTWLPAYVYSEESDAGYLFGVRKLKFKGQSRIWGYNVGKSNRQDELTALTVEADQVKDTVDQAEGMSPVRALRAWERLAEDNVIQRLEKASLLAPDGEVNKILETVVNNLEVTNNLDITPEVRARVMLTAPLESFTIGHTIVVSRGLIDVLPDEASLAMVLAHELAHIALGHRLDTKYSFSDRMLFDDEKTFKKLRVKRDPAEESAADQKAMEYLQNSPYKDKLGAAGLFLRALNERANELPNLLQAHMGNRMADGSKIERMPILMQTAPKLETGRVDQIAALPLGGRIKVDGWTNRIELVKAKPVALLSAREKMPFEVTPVFLYLTRQQTADTVASTATQAAKP